MTFLATPPEATARASCLVVGEAGPVGTASCGWLPGCPSLVGGFLAGEFRGSKNNSGDKSFIRYISSWSVGFFIFLVVSF